MAETKKIVLLGDSILDNFYWLENKDRDLTTVINEKLTEHDFICFNFAVDESKLEDVINGCVPKQVYSEARPYPYPVDESGRVVPLKLTEDIKPDYIFLSIGGNDFRINIFKMLFGVEYFISHVLTTDYRQKYEDLIIKLKQMSKRVVLVSFFTPYLGPESRYKLLESYREILREHWNEFISHLAKKHKLILVDLDKLYNPYDRTHYGSTEIEPSDLMTEKMAEIVKSIVLKKREQ